MRLSTPFPVRAVSAARAATAALAALAPLLHVATAGGQQPAAPPKEQDLLGNIVVVAGATRPLPKIGIIPSLASDMEDVTLHSVVRRDLDLSGEFNLIPDSGAPSGLYLSDSKVDIPAWRGKGAEALVRVSGKKRNATQAELRAEVYFMNQGDTPVFDKRYAVPLSQVREGSHRVADLVIGALTGQNGGFSSHMTFAASLGGMRRVYTMDADGHDAATVSPMDKVSIAPAYGKNGELYFASAARGEPFRIQNAKGAVVPIPYDSSVYGIAFSRDHSKVAVSLGVGKTIKVFSGPDFASLKPASEVGMALHPAFTPTGKLMFSGEGKWGQRVYVDGKPISPDGLFASSPVACNHPDGIKIVFAAGAGKDTDLVVTGERGGSLARLTQHQGRNGYPACSPDGRLVAFFSTRKSGEGPGLYIMRVDGSHPKRVSPLLGDSLRWDALPPTAIVELKAGM
jgi:TolB protein